MREKIILVGGGGHSKIIIDSINQEKYEIVGILDNSLSIGTKIMNVNVIGDDDIANGLYNEGVYHAVITTVGNRVLFDKLLKKYLGIGFSFPNIIHPASHISSSAQIGQGVSILVNSCVNAEAHIGNYVTVNSNVVIEHDCEVGSESHIAPGAVLLGGCKIGSNCLIGAGSVILPQVKICDNCVVGAGSIVVKDIMDEGIVCGNPAHYIKRTKI